MSLTFPLPPATPEDVFLKEAAKHARRDTILNIPKATVHALRAVFKPGKHGKPPQFARAILCVTPGSDRLDTSEINQLYKHIGMCEGFGNHTLRDAETEVRTKYGPNYGFRNPYKPRRSKLASAQAKPPAPAGAAANITPIEEAPDGVVGRSVKTRRSRLDPFLGIIGKVPDREVAERAHCTPENVRMYRKKRGIPASWMEAQEAVPADPTPTDSTPQTRVDRALEPFLHLLGKLTDQEVADMAGISRASVGDVRRFRGIPRKGASSPHLGTLGQIIDDMATPPATPPATTLPPTSQENEMKIPEQVKPNGETLSTADRQERIDNKARKVIVMVQEGPDGDAVLRSIWHQIVDSHAP